MVRLATPPGRNSWHGTSGPRTVGLLGSLVLWVCAGGLLWAQSEQADTPPSVTSAPTASAPQGIPDTLSLIPGQISSLTVSHITRVAIGNAEVADVTVVSESEVLLQAKSAGTTNLILWDDSGQHTTLIEVADRAPEALEALVKQLNLPNVLVKRENAKLFLVGDVPRQEDFDRLEQMLASFQGVTNLIQVVAPSAAPARPVLVKLMVQLIEISRKELEKLGVKWFESVEFTEPQVEDLTGAKALFRWGASLQRGKVSTTLNALVTRNKARILAEPKLVTTNDVEASSHLGVDVPVITTATVGTGTGTTTASIDFRKVGVLLRMTPHVDPRDPMRQITMKMETEVSSIDKTVGLQVPVGGQSVLVPGFKVRKANTEVTTTSGDTVVIAGLLQLDESHNVSQVPAMGSLPVVGRLFRSPEKQSEQLELLIAITPELLEDSSVTMEKEVALEQALAVFDVTASAKDPTLRYALQVQERIAKSLRYPQDDLAQRVNTQVKLRVHLLRDGTLRDTLIAESSGFDAFDQAAVRAAKSQSPFPMFPADLVQQDLWLELPVLFRP